MEKYGGLQAMQSPLIGAEVRSTTAMILYSTVLKNEKEKAFVINRAGFKTVPSSWVRLPYAGVGAFLSTALPKHRGRFGKDWVQRWMRHNPGRKLLSLEEFHQEEVDIPIRKYIHNRKVKLKRVMTWLQFLERLGLPADLTIHDSRYPNLLKKFQAPPYYRECMAYDPVAWQPPVKRRKKSKNPLEHGYGSGVRRRNIALQKEQANEQSRVSV